MKKIFLFSFIIIVCFSGFSQTREIDSLKQILKSTKSKYDKMDLYQKLSQAYIHNNIEQTLAYSDSLFQLSKTQGNIKMEMESVYLKGVVSRLTGNFQDAETYFNDYLEYAETTNDNEILSKANYQLASVNVYLDKKEGAISKYFEALKYLENSDNDTQKAKILNGIAIVYNGSGQYKKSKDNNLKALNTAIRAKDSSLISILYNGLGVTLKNQDSTEKALDYFRKSLTIAEKTNNTRVMGFQYRNIGTIYSMSGDYDKSEYFLEKALSIRRQLKNETTIGGSLSDLANVYIQTNRLDKAESYLNEAIAIFKKNKSISNENTMYYYLSELEAKRGNSDKSFSLIDKYYITKDSLESIQLKETLNEIDIKYQTEKKDKTILENELKLEKSQAKTQTMTILIISLLLASILLWFVFQQRQKRIQQQLVTIQKEQEVLTLESLIAGEEKERLRIAKELHDGVNGDLSAIKYKLSALLKMNNDVINEAVTMIDNSCQQVRAISHNLVPPSLKNFNLIEAVNNYCENMNNTHAPAINFQHIGDTVDLNKKIEVNIFRIIQELVTNAIKHAKAEDIDVQISNINNTMLISVEDDGKGYSQTENTASGIGLTNIKSRVEYLNATFEVVTNTNGTSNTIEIDLNTL